MAFQAKVLLDNPAFTKAVDDIRKGILAAWTGTPLNDVKAREEYHRRYLALATIEGILRDYLQTGIMHSVRVEQERDRESKMARLKRFWSFDTKPETEGIV